MTPFTQLSGVAAPLPLDNVDTDAIIPSRETQSVSRQGYGERLFANWRYAPGTRIEQPGFILNRPGYRSATILVAGANFGCGSSREAAAWSLVQFGIRCVIAASFGNIFRGNCIRNGVLPLTLPADVIQALLADCASAPRTLHIDLEACRVTDAQGGRHAFTIDTLERDMLLSGESEIALTLARRELIQAWQQTDRAARPWIWQRASTR